MAAPAHYAHLAASRARVLVINGKYESFRELSKTRSLSSCDRTKKFQFSFENKVECRFASQFPKAVFSQIYI